VILDCSAIIAIVCREQGFEGLLRKIGLARKVLIGAPTLAETQLALTVKLGYNASGITEQFLTECQAVVVPFHREHVGVLFGAFLTYGKGRHPARLNMGDCFTYGTAKVAGLPVLFVGQDFSLTDLEAA